MYSTTGMKRSFSLQQSSDSFDLSLHLLQALHSHSCSGAALGSAVPFRRRSPLVFPQHALVGTGNMAVCSHMNQRISAYKSLSPRVNDAIPQPSRDSFLCNLVAPCSIYLLHDPPPIVFDGPTSNGNQNGSQPIPRLVDRSREHDDYSCTSCAARL